MAFDWDFDDELDEFAADWDIIGLFESKKEREEEAERKAAFTRTFDEIMALPVTYNCPKEEL